MLLVGLQFGINTLGASGTRRVSFDNALAIYPHIVRNRSGEYNAAVKAITSLSVSPKLPRFSRNAVTEQTEGLPAVWVRRQMSAAVYCGACRK